jgi:hypothetical protein
MPGVILFVRTPQVCHTLHLLCIYPPNPQAAVKSDLDALEKRVMEKLEILLEEKVANKLGVMLAAMEARIVAKLAPQAALGVEA